MKMQTLRYEFVLIAEQPIAHHAETIGNEAILMREKIRQKGGGFADVPIGTGDTARHGLREAAAYALLDAAGMLDEPGLSEAALRLLFAGGMVTGKGDAGAISLDVYREMTELIPSLRLLGGCTNSRVIPGQLNVDPMVLICTETEYMLSKAAQWVLMWMTEHAERLESCRAHIDEVQRVRMDPLLVPEKRLLLSTDAQVSATKKLAASEAAHDANDSRGQEREKSGMMPRRHETLVRGSLLWWGFEARCYYREELRAIYGSTVIDAVGHG